MAASIICRCNLYLEILTAKRPAISDRNTSELIIAFISAKICTSKGKVTFHCVLLNNITVTKTIMETANIKILARRSFLIIQGSNIIRVFFYYQINKQAEKLPGLYQGK